jgi:hypothetical protein
VQFRSGTDALGIHNVYASTTRRTPVKISLTRHGIGLLALVAAMPATAQTTDPQKFDQAAIQRSLAIQAQIAQIGQNKQAFINTLVASWQPNVNAALFGNVSNELQPLMETATPWKLYAASLVGDYNTMMQVLRGEIKAGSVINALSTPQPHTAATSSLAVGSVSPLAIGSTTSQLVFTPIPPCRIADTRGTGARTGLLLAGVPRTFDLSTGGFGKGQGGSTSCPGLPSFNFYAWSVNLTATLYSTSGYLQVYPFGGAVPATSILNFQAGTAAIANSSTLTGCYGCTDSINVVASASTDLILDVYGYFEVATGFSTGVVTLMAGTTASVPAGVYQFVQGGACPAGTIVIGGAQTNSSSSTNTILTSDHNITGTSWYEYVKNTGTSTATVTVYSTCQDVS